MALSIKTSTTINASPEAVWNVFTNFEDYPNWNPFLKEVSGDLKVGNTIHINAGGMKFTPKVLVFSKNKELKWLGKFLFAGIFDGEHRFLLTQNADGTTTFEQSEIFKGILVPFFKKKLQTETLDGFKAMNAQLKVLVEQRVML